MSYPSLTTILKQMYLSNSPAKGLPLQTVVGSLIKSSLSQAGCTSSNLNNRNVFIQMYLNHCLHLTE